MLNFFKCSLLTILVLFFSTLSYYIELYFRKKDMLESSPSIPPNAALFGTSVIADVTSEEEVILEWSATFVHCVWCPYKKKRQRHKKQKTQRQAGKTVGKAGGIDGSWVTTNQGTPVPPGTEKQKSSPEGFKETMV